MLSSEKFTLSVSTLSGSREITLTKRIALTPQEQVLLKYIFSRKELTSKGCATVWGVCVKKNKDR